MEPLEPRVLLHSVFLDLPGGSDLGVSDTDNITSVPTLVIAVQVSGAGQIDLDYDDDGTPDDTLVVGAAGTYDVTTDPLDDGVHDIDATFTPDGEAPVYDTLTVTIDTQGPTIAPTPGGALSFDGTQYAAVPHSSSFDAIEDADIVTVEAWVYVDSYYSGWFPIIDKYEATGDFGWKFELYQSNGPHFDTGHGIRTFPPHFVPDAK